MKKFLSFIFTLLLFISTDVKADMGAPIVPEIKYYVSNLDGAYKYKEKYDSGKIEFIKTDEKFNYNDELELICTTDDNDYCVNRIDGYDIKSSDITVIKENFTKEDGVKLGHKMYAKVFNENGIDIYSGPSHKFYKKVGHIPYGGEVEYEYTDSSGDDIQSLWKYVTYNNVSGWINIPMVYSANQVATWNGTKRRYIIATKDYFLTNKIYSYSGWREEQKEEKVDVDIPLNTELECTYNYNPWPKQGYCLTNYNGKEYWLMTVGGTPYSFGTGVNYGENDRLVVAKKDSDIYDNLVDKNVIGHISTGKSYIYKYISYERRESDTCDSNSSDNSCWEPIPYHYINHNGINGWIDASSSGDEQVVIDESSNEEIEKSDKEIIFYDKTKKIIASDKNTILYCVVGGIVISLTALVIIVLRKKKQKTAETKKEIKRI